MMTILPPLVHLMEDNEEKISAICSWRSCSAYEWASILRLFDTIFNDFRPRDETSHNVENPSIPNNNILWIPLKSDCQCVRFNISVLHIVMAKWQSDDYMKGSKCFNALMFMNLLVLNWEWNGLWILSENA